MLVWLLYEIMTTASLQMQFPAFLRKISFQSRLICNIKGVPSSAESEKACLMDDDDDDEEIYYFASSFADIATVAHLRLLITKQNISSFLQLPTATICIAAAAEEVVQLFATLCMSKNS